MNFSRRGVGYSWGFRGFRVSRDARKRLVRTISIPGTGLYKREYLTPGNSSKRPVVQRSSTKLHYALPILILIILTIFGGLRVAAIGSALMLVFYILLRIAFPSQSPVPALDEPPLEVRPLFNEMEVALKGTLRKKRIASHFGTLFESALLSVLVKFAALDGSVSAQEGQVLLDVLGQIHPRQYSGLSGEEAISLIQGQVKLHTPSEAFALPLLIQLARGSGSQSDAAYADRFAGLLCGVARRMAIADGPLTPQEQSELAKLSGLLRAKTTVQADSQCADNRSVDVTFPVGKDALQPVPVAAIVPPSSPGTPSVEAFGCSLRDIIPAIKPFVDPLLPLVQDGLRKLNIAAQAENIVEGDIARVTAQFGASKSQIPQSTATEYLTLLRTLHPERTEGWDVDASIAALKATINSLPNLYALPAARPVTLQVLEQLPITNNAELLGNIKEFFLYLSRCAATTGGVADDGLLSSFTDALNSH